MDANSAHLSVVLGAAQIDQAGNQWIEVIPTCQEARNGSWYFTITSDDLTTYAQSIQAQPGLIPVDYDHTDQQGTVAAGWFTGQTRIVQAGDHNPAGTVQDHESLWAEVKWTPQAVTEIRDGRYKRLSPEFTFQQRDSKTGLLTRAKEIVASTLTNRPFFRHLAPVTAAADDDTLEALAASVLDKISDRLADITNGGRAAPIKEATVDTSVLATALGLNEDASESDIIQAVKAAQDKATAQAVDDPHTVKLSKADLAKLEADAQLGVKAAHDLAEMRVTAMLDTAERERRIVPAERESLTALCKDGDRFDNERISGVQASLVARTPRPVEYGSGGDGKEHPADASPDEVKAAERRYTWDTYSPDADSLNLHVKATAILAEQGKTNPTADEYLAAIEQAERAA